jgi:hypothetical protein
MLVVVVALVVVVVVVVVAAACRGHHKPKPFQPPAASQKFGDDANLMRRLQRKKLVQRSH